MEELEALEKMWEKECVINETALIQETARIPQLISKYYNLMTRAHMKVMRLKTELACLYLAKEEYYAGTMAREDLEARGWKPYQRKIVRSDLPKYIEADKDYIALSMKLGLQVLIEEKLEAIVKELNNRNYLITNMIKWAMFTNGTNY